MNKVLKLNGEKFRLGWLFKFSFWVLIFSSIIAKLGKVVVLDYQSHNSSIFSIGTSTPLSHLWDKGYRVSLKGFVFNMPILEYYKKDNIE